MAPRWPAVRRESATAVRAEAIEAPPQRAAEILERCLEFGVEELAPWDHDEIDRDVASDPASDPDSDPRREPDLGSKHLSNQPFRTVSLDGAADLPGGHHPQPGTIECGLQEQERKEPAVNPLAGIEDGAELAALANPSLAWKSCRRAASPRGGAFHRRRCTRLRAHRLHSLTAPGPVTARTWRPSRTCPAEPTRRKP